MIKNNRIYTFLMVSIAIPLISYADFSDRMVATINVGVTPAGIALTPDNNFAYVANNNNYSIPGGDTVSVLNLKNNTLLQTISDSSFNEPYTITLSPDGTKAYVTNSNGSTVTIINTLTNTVIGTIGGFDGPSGMAINPSGTTGYVNNYGGPIAGSGYGTTVSVVDLTTNAIVDTIIVGQAPAALAMTPDGAFVYVINYINGSPNAGTISVIQTSNNTVVTTILGFSGPFGIAITPDGQYAYVTNFGSNNFTPIGTTVSVVNIATNTIVATINLAIQPAGVAITPDGRYAYVTNYNTLYSDSTNFTGLTAGQGTVNIIDIDCGKVIPPTLDVGQSPANIAISSDGKFAYVSNYTSNTVTVLDILERMWLK